MREHSLTKGRIFSPIEPKGRIFSPIECADCFLLLFMINECADCFLLLFMINESYRKMKDLFPVEVEPS